MAEKPDPNTRENPQDVEPDPEERFGLYPLATEDALRALLGVRPVNGRDVTVEFDVGWPGCRAREGVVVRNRVICVLSIAALIVLAGCGSPSSTPTATSAPPPEPPAATTPASAPPAPADEPSSSPPGTAAPAQPAPAQPAAADESPPPPPDTAATAAGGVLSEGDSPLAVLVRLLAALPLATENSADYDRGDYEHDRAYLCDTSGVDPYTGLTFDSSNCDVDHIVAAKEAHESGGYNWSVATRQQFGNDELNLVATRACVNRSKGSRDAAEWSDVQSGACAGATLTTEGRCFWAARTVAVKHRYNLALDTSEHTAVEAGLNQCPQDIDIAATSLATITTIPATETPPTTETPPPESDCHPAYEPCLPNLPGDALNCGDLTAQQRPVRVKQIGVDPYRFDRDGDGRGCTS